MLTLHEQILLIFPQIDCSQSRSSQKRNSSVWWQIAKGLGKVLVLCRLLQQPHTVWTVRPQSVTLQSVATFSCATGTHKGIDHGRSAPSSRAFCSSRLSLRLPAVGWKWVMSFNLSLEKARQNAEAVLKTYELFIYRDIHYISHMTTR